MSSEGRRFRIPPAVGISVAALCVVLAVVIVVRTLRKSPPAGFADLALLKCVACEKQFEKTMSWVSENWVAEDDVLMTPGSVCPSCSEKALAFAWKCPNDSTVFYRNLYAKEGGKIRGKWAASQVSQKCPKCGWSGGENAAK